MMLSMSSSKGGGVMLAATGASFCATTSMVTGWGADVLAPVSVTVNVRESPPLKLGAGV